MERKQKNGNPLRTDDLEKADDNVKKPNLKKMRKFWNGFRMLTPNSAIILGTLAMNDQRFTVGSRGRQAIPCSITAIVFSNILSPENWNKDYVDSVILHGDRIFRISRTKNRVYSDVRMTSNLVYPEFFIDEYKCRICATASIVNGNLFSENCNCSDLINGVESFFKIAEAGVITTQDISVGIWCYKNDQYFYFDPAPCADNGSRLCGGSACLMRFNCLNAMLDFILSKLNKETDSKYCIDRINILDITAISKNDPRLPNQVKTSKKENLSCSGLKFEQSNIKTSKIRRIPVSIKISNTTAQQTAVEHLVTYNNFDTDYTYSGLRVNIPLVFKQLSSSVSILHGWTHESSEMYKGKGAQNVVNCLFSIGMKKVNPVKTWLRTTLDEILTLGDAAYIQFKIEKPNIKELTGIDLNGTKVQIGNQKMIAKVDMLTIIGTLTSRKTSVLNLRQAVEEFFLININGIIETSIMAVAIWIEDEYYCMFDPRQCDQNGVRVIEDNRKGGNVKKGNEAGNEKKITGKSCVMIFSDINSLTLHVIKNIPLGKKNVRFVIRNIDIVKDEPGTQAWHNFEPGEINGTWSLQGSNFPDDERLDNKSLESLNIAIAIVALVFAKKISPSDWTNETVDDVRREGEEYYNWCFPPNQNIEKFDFSHLKKVLYVKNQKVNLELEEAIIVDNINVESMNRHESLEGGINKFFENYQFGVVEVNDISFAIWKELDSKDPSKKTYYIFRTKGKKNLEKNELVDCAIRILNVQDLAKVIDMNLEYGTESDVQFLIHNVNIPQIGNVMTNEEIKNDKNTTLKPDLYQYISINEEIASLNGTINQGNELIFGNQTRDKQQSANALVALAMTKLHNPHLWLKEVVDDILKLGDKITAENMNNLPASEDEKTRTCLLPTEINNEFNIGVNHIRFELQEDSAVGKLNNLSKILEEFFAQSDLGIFKIESTIMPIWKQDPVFFTMDPKGRNSAAAILWFTSISALASHLVEIIGGNGGVDFSIDSISIENYYETRLTEQEKQRLSAEDMWYNFERKSEGIWFINGNIEFTDERFTEENRGKQSAAIAIMGIVYSNIYLPHRWTAALLDEVIVSGDKLHSMCVTRLENSTIPRVNQIMNEILLSDRRINLFIKDCVQSGGFDNRSIKIQDLSSGLNKFFYQYPAGILIVNEDINFAIWKFKDFYYCILPKAQIMRFTENQDLVNQLLNYINLIDFEIIAIDVINWNKMSPGKFDPSPTVNPSTLPSLNAFKRLQGEARALLRGSSHQASEIFSKKVHNRQAAANCIIALGMAVIKSPDTWTKSTLDEVLSIGNTLYRESLKASPTKEKLNPDDIIRVFHLGHNVLTVDVSEPIISGKVSLPPPEPETKGKKGKKKAKPDRKKKKGKVKRGPLIPPLLILLEEGIKRFFENNNAGVLMIGRKVIAIWKQLGVYFLYVSYAWNDKDVNDHSGSSCVAWFACMQPFYSYICSHLEGSDKFATFDIRKVLFNITAIQSLPCSVDLTVCDLSTVSNISNSKNEKITLSGIKALNNYNYEHKKIGILRGTRNMNDTMFDESQRGLQSTAIAVVAIVVGSIHVPSTWTPDIIDAILIYGDFLHHDSCRLHKICSRNLSPSELQKVFIVGDFRAYVHVHHYTMTGLLYFYDLAETLRFFFRSNNCGILHTNNVTMAVTQHYGKFCVFFPCRGNGKSKNNEPACVMKFATVAGVAHAVVTNYNSDKPSVYTLNAVNVLNLYFFSNSKRSYLLPCGS